MKTIFPLIVLLLLAVPCFAQVKPNPVLFTESRSPNCEALSRDLDVFYLRLADDPGTSGIIAIRGKTNDLRKNLVYEEMIRVYFLRRQLGPGRINIIRSSLGNDLEISFWIKSDIDYFQLNGRSLLRAGLISPRLLS